MAHVHYNSNTKTYPLDKTAGDILQEFVPLDALQYCDLFYHSRKIGRDQKLSEIKGIEPGRTLRILERKSDTRDQQRPPKDLREQAVSINKQFKKMPAHLERIIVEDTWKPDYIKNLLEKYPVITEQPALINVLSDYSLLEAMFHEEHGFIQQHPIFIKIVQDMLEAFSSNGGFKGFEEFLRRSGLFRDQPNQQRPSTSSAQRDTPRVANFTSDMLQQALAQSLVGNVNSNVPGPSNQTTASNTPPESMEVDASQQANPAETYATQNTHLHEFGFTNNEENISALIISNGDIEGAIEFIISNRNQMDDLD